MDLYLLVIPLVGIPLATFLMCSWIEARVNRGRNV